MVFLALSVYLFIFFVRPHEWGGIEGETSLITNSLLLALAFFLFSRQKNLKAPQLTLMAMFVIAGFLSRFLSMGSLGWVGGGITSAESLLRTNFIPFMLISSALDSRLKTKLFFLLLVFMALFMALNGISQLLAGEAGSWIGIAGNSALDQRGTIRIRYLGLLSDPNDLGMLFVMALPVVIYLGNSSNILLKCVFLAACVMLLYGIYLTNSRGTLLATLSLLAFWHWRKYGLSRSVLMGVISSPVIFFFVLSNFRSISASDESSEGRLEAWYAGYQMLQSSPLFGVGQGGGFVDWHGLTAHNSFVLVFAEMGLFGCFIWTTLIVVTIQGLFWVSSGKFIQPSTELQEKTIKLAQEESRIATTLLYSFFSLFCFSFFLKQGLYASFIYISRYLFGQPISNTIIIKRFLTDLRLKTCYKMVNTNSCRRDFRCKYYDQNISLMDRF